MSVANSPQHDNVAGAAVPAVERKPLFKEDRPKHIDRYISFFGEEGDQDAVGAPGTLELADQYSTES
jgi:hypothetical protein